MAGLGSAGLGWEGRSTGVSAINASYAQLHGHRCQNANYFNCEQQTLANQLCLSLHSTREQHNPYMTKPVQHPKGPLGCYFIRDEQTPFTNSPLYLLPLRRVGDVGDVLHHLLGRLRLPRSALTCTHKQMSTLSCTNIHIVTHTYPIT